MMSGYPTKLCCHDTTYQSNGSNDMCFFLMIDWFLCNSKLKKISPVGVNKSLVFKWYQSLATNSFGLKRSESKAIFQLYSNLDLDLTLLQLSAIDRRALN